MRTLFTSVFALALASCAAAPAVAQSQTCAPSQEVISRLADKYGESVQSSGLIDENTALVTFANTETGTWTVVASSANGVSCFIASGEYFTQYNLEPAAQGEES